MNELKKQINAINEEKKKPKEIKYKKTLLKKVEKKKNQVLCFWKIKFMMKMGYFNFTDNERDILEKLARDERMIDYANLVFKLYELFIDLLNKKISINEAK